MLLRKKAAEELKKEQERKAAERRRIIEERCGTPKPVDGANQGMLTCFSLRFVLHHPVYFLSIPKIPTFLSVIYIF